MEKVSIPYGKGKGKFENAHEIISNKVSIPYGKGKVAGAAGILLLNSIRRTP